MAVLGEGKFTYEVSGDDWGALPEGWTYNEATAVSVDSKDNVYVFNRGGHSMIVFNPEGKLIRSWGEGVFNSPHGVTVGPDDTVWCADNSDHTVRHFTAEGKLLLTLGTADKPALPMSGEPFNGPTHLAVDPIDGYLYVTDGYTNAVVHKYTPDGKHVTAWGESGTDPGQFNTVHNIATDREGWIYVADRDNRRIQVFDRNGKVETVWNNFSRAACIYIDKRTDEQLVYVGEYFAGINTNYMADRLGPRVSIMDRQGNVIARLGEHSYGDEPGRFYAPHGITVDSKGNIYVAEVAWSEYGKMMDPPKELRSMQKLVKKG